MSIMTFNEYYDKWLEDHAYSDSAIVKGWLKLSYFICTRIFLPLKFTPLKIDFLSLAFSILIIVIFSFFPYLDNVGLLISGFMIIVLLLSIGMMDNIDGIIARLTNKNSQKGSYQDLIFDRVNDGIIIIAPIFSNYTKISIILFLLFTVFIFENLRSIHISAGIPIFSTVAERHARLIFQIGYIGISSCGYYIISLGYNVQISIGGKNIYFWPNLDILYICLGLISIIGIVQLTLKILKTKMSPIKLSNNKKKGNKINEFEEAYKNLISVMYLYEYKNYVKKLGYFQGKKLNRMIKNPMNLFLTILITHFILFFVFIIKFNLKSLDFINLHFNMIFLIYFLLFMGNLKKILYYSSYRGNLSTHHLIFFHLLDLITEVLLLSILSLYIPKNIFQIFVVFCLIVQLCHSANILNQRRKVIQEKAYFSHTYFNFIMLFSLVGIFFNLFIQSLYFWIAFTFLLLILLIKKIYQTNSLLQKV